GEQVMVLPPLRLPDSDASREAVEETDAVRLFLDRARRQLPDFTLEGDRARLVAQLCLRLDGIPLALELAAARVRTLSIEQIHERLDDRFRLLTAGARTALPRHRTLRAALD